MKTLFARIVASRMQWHASLLSMLILSLALLTLWLGHHIPQSVDETLEVREIAISTPPPPPPPPTVQQVVADTSVTLQVQGEGVAMQMVQIKENVKVRKPDMPAIETQALTWQVLDVNWDAFDLNELDGLPTLLSTLRLKLPVSLTRRGINEVRIKLDLFVDEGGRASLVSIVENPYPELESEIHRFVRDIRFSAPQKDNQPVRARFTLPVEIKS